MNKASAIAISFACSALLAGCMPRSEREIGRIKAEAACGEWADQAPDWTKVRLTDSYSSPIIKEKTFRRMCGTDWEKGLTLGNQFTERFINSSCHFGDRCNTDLKGAIETVKTWSWED